MTKYNEIENNYTNKNIKYVVIIMDIDNNSVKNNDEIRFLINTISTVPFLNKEDATKYIEDLKEMELQGILIKIKNSSEEDILIAIDEVENENR